MECNKDEAIRALEIAERKMQNNDFAGAKKFALKSRQLYANLDNISMILAICEVHCSAQIKMFGSDVDWYDVLQIEKMADEVAVKKQYRKLALLLHPDKNKFAGAEAAFKLIGEANRVLSNKITRSVFDLKVRAFMKTSVLNPKPPSHPSSGASIVGKHQKSQHGVNISANRPFKAACPQKKSQTSQKGIDKFWTLCPHCRTSLECFKMVIGGQMSCNTCKSTFTANETKPPVNQSNTSSSKPECFSSEGNSGSFHMGRAATGKAAQYNGRSGGNSGGNCMPTPPTKGGFPVGSKQKFNDLGGVNVNAQKSCSKSDPRKLVLGLMADTSNSKNKKRGRAEVVDFSQRSGRLGDFNADADQDKIYSKMEGKCDTREPCQNEKNDSYAESLNDEGEFPTSSKLPDTVHSNIKSKNEAGIDKGLKNDDCNVFANSKNGVEEGVKRYNGTSPDVSNKKRKLTKQRTSNLVEENVDGFEEKDLGVEPDTSPVNYECPEPEFSIFDKDRERKCFDVDQIWAAYDTVDAMPRFYARVRRVISTDFKLEVTWLEPVTRGVSNAKWVDKGLPTACGVFKYKNTEVGTEHRMFSHQMCFELGKIRSSFVIYPQASEIWALFRNWDIGWANDPEKHKPYKFEFVVVLSDFDLKKGVKVAYLKKLKGFVGLFRRMTQDEGSSPFYIPPANLFRFSHRIPASQMSGTVRDDVPEGSYELDTASLPNDIDELDDLMDGNTGNERKDTTSDISFQHYTECGENLRSAFGTEERNDTHKKHSLDDAKQCLAEVKSSKAFPNKAQSLQESRTAASNQDNDCMVVTQNPTTVIRRSPRGLSGKKSSTQNAFECTPH